MSEAADAIIDFQLAMQKIAGIEKGKTVTMHFDERALKPFLRRVAPNSNFLSAAIPNGNLTRLDGHEFSDGFLTLTGSDGYNRGVELTLEPAEVAFQHHVDPRKSCVYVLEGVHTPDAGVPPRPLMLYPWGSEYTDSDARREEYSALNVDAKFKDHTKYVASLEDVADAMLERVMKKVISKVCSSYGVKSALVNKSLFEPTRSEYVFLPTESFPALSVEAFARSKQQSRLLLGDIEDLANKKIPFPHWVASSPSKNGTLYSVMFELP